MYNSGNCLVKESGEDSSSVEADCMSRDRFQDRHIGPGEDEIAVMLKRVGVSSLDELIDKLLQAPIPTKGNESKNQKEGAVEGVSIAEEEVKKDDHDDSLRASVQKNTPLHLVKSVGPVNLSCPVLETYCNSTNKSFISSLGFGNSRYVRPSIEICCKYIILWPFTIGNPIYDG